MQVLNFKDLNNVNFPKTAVALGSFEALHAGHLNIIENTVKYAKENNLRSIITIFREPVLKNRTTVCETFQERLEIIESTGADYVVVFDFNDEFKKLEYFEFFYKFIVEIFNASAVFTGFNYRFGNNAIGNIEKLLTLCTNCGIVLNVTPPIAFKEIISSTYIHKLINDGDVRELNRVLLRPYSIKGTVISGRNIGNKLGFPTANIDFPENKAIVKQGVYFGTAETDFGTFYTIINVGLQPTVTEDFTPRIEAHLLDFDKEIYERSIRLKFIERFRDIKHFISITELKEQLIKDKEKAYEIIKANTI